MNVIELRGKFLRSASRNWAAGEDQEGKGFAVRLSTSGIIEQRSFEEPITTVKCNAERCLFASTNNVYSDSGELLLSVSYIINDILYLKDKVIISHEEGVSAFSNSKEGRELWYLGIGPTFGIEVINDKLFVGTPYGVVEVSEGGRIVKEHELGAGNWRVVPSCDRALLLVNEENADAYVMYVKEELEPLGRIPNVMGTPSLSPDCKLVAVPICGIVLYNVYGEELTRKGLTEVSDECEGVVTSWFEGRVMSGINDEGLMRSLLVLFNVVS